jgi:K+/H+ antiporter YhaU regulatory subunit KhtT
VNCQLMHFSSLLGVLLFVNRVNLGFEDVEDVDPTTVIELTAEDLKEDADSILLKFVNYQRVKSITLFIEDNNGGDVSALGGLKFFGKTIATTNMADFKKQG